jgi:hypothetical protein
MLAIMGLVLNAVFFSFDTMHCRLSLAALLIALLERGPRLHVA